LPAGSQAVPYFPLATAVQDGEDCFVIGSQNNGPAWWIRSGNVSQQFEYPEGLSQFAAGVASAGSSIDRDRVTVIVTDTRISNGDSGGPLLNAKGEVIGVTFATPANRSAGSVGWHISLRHVRNFVGTLPKQPEGIPFDPWTAGVPAATMAQPELIDGDRDGRNDSIRYRYIVQPTDEGGDANPRAVALTTFVDFAQRDGRSEDGLDRVPLGLWGMEDRGRFRFDLFFTTRVDGVTAVGYTNPDGIVDEIRVGRARQEAANVTWRRGANGIWTAVKPTGVSMIDSARVGPANLRTLQMMTGQGGAPPEARGPTISGSRQGPNVIR
jgi:hypothetical protein